MLELDEAKGIILEAAKPLSPVRLPLYEASGRVLAEEVRADADIPPFPNSAMDGFAVRAEDVAAASSAAPAVLDVIGTLAAGQVPAEQVRQGTAYRIMTGAPLPEGADAIVMREFTESFGARVRIMAPAREGDYVRAAGEDMRAGQVVLEPGTVLRPAELGVLATVGVAEPLVYPAPRVAVLATGSELQPVEEPLAPGHIRNSNSYTLHAQVLATGAVPVPLGAVADDEAATEQKIREALECDVVITSGGVSVGEYDFVKRTHEKLGTQFQFWRINIKPGKPVAFGVNQSTLVFGLPGNPSSSMVTFEQLVRPALLKMMAYPSLERLTVEAVAAERFAVVDGKTHFKSVKVTRDGEGYAVRLAGGQGSHMITSMAKANAFVVLTPERQQVEVGERVRVQLIDPPERIV